MTINYKCPECDSEMVLDEAEKNHVCPSEECGKTLTIDEAASLFEEGEIVGIVDESDLNDETAKGDIVVTDIDEDLDKIFEGQSDLSEEFKEKAKTIFEVAIKSRVGAIKTELEEEFATQKETYEQDMVEKVDGYLDHVVAKWVEENKIEVAAGLKQEMTESFMDGLATLFKEHYFDVPEDKVDIVESLATKVSDLESKIDEEVEASIKATKSLKEAEKAIVFLKNTTELAETEKEKLMGLVEEVEFEDADSFLEKLTTIKESFLVSGNAGKSTDDVVTLTEADKNHVAVNDSSVAAAVALLKKKD